MRAGREKPRESTDSRRGKKWWLYFPLLLVLVSITSFLAGTRIGRGIDQQLGQMLDTIVLSPDGETVNKERIDFSGQIKNADGSPCVNQLLELHSEPVRTVTDSDGFFYFRNVEIGEHQLSMLDETGQPVSEVKVQIGRDKSVDYGQEKKETDGSYSLTVSEDVIVIHIQIQMDREDQMVVEPGIYTRKPNEDFRNEDGESQGTVAPHELPQKDQSAGAVPESGEGQIDQENESRIAAEETGAGAEGQNRPGTTSGGQTAETGQPSAPDGQTAGDAETSASGESITEAAGPLESQESIAESTAESTSGQPSTEATTQSGAGGDSDSGSSGSRPTKPADVTVQENNGPVWAQNTTISLFADRTGVGAERKLAPGSRGSYGFSVNNRNSYGVIYRMSMSAPDGQLLLPLRYRLKCKGSYVCGDDGTWLTAEQMSASPVSLAAGADEEYLLEWQWLYDGGDDEYDTRIGTAANLEYHVTVTVTIEQVLS